MLKPETLCAFLLEAHRADPDDGAEPFRRWAMRRLREFVAFDLAAWGDGAIGAEVRLDAIELHAIDPGALALMAASAASDPHLARVLENPGEPVAYSLDSSHPRAMHDFAEATGAAHALSTAAFDRASGLAQGIVLYRRSGSDPFGDAEVSAMRALFGHLTLAWTRRQLDGMIRARRDLFRTPGHAASAGPDRVLRTAEPGFLRVLRAEWPDWSGPRLPEPIAVPVDAGGEALHIGRQAVVRAIRGDGILMLRARLRVTADMLTARERQAAELAAAGRSDKEIAAALGIALATARNHIAAIHRRLGTRNRVEIAERLREAR